MQVSVQICAHAFGLIFAPDYTIFLGLQLAGIIAANMMF
jgi:hypothetical protein